MGVTVFTKAVCRQMSCVLHLSLLLYYSVYVFMRCPKSVEGNPDPDKLAYNSCHNTSAQPSLLVGHKPPPFLHCPLLLAMAS